MFNLGLIAVLLAFAAPATAQVSADALSDLAAWWEAEGSADDTFGLSNGSLVGGSAFTTGVFGDAFEFDGTSGYVDVAPGVNLDFGTRDFSVSVWINLDTLSVGASDGIRSIFHKVVGTVLVDAKSYFLEYEAQTAQLRFAIGQDGLLQNDLLAPATLVAGQWHHVAAVRDGDTNSLYLDGVLLDSQSAGASVDTGTGGVSRIGNIAPHGIVTPRFFDGKIDELALYSRALSSSEIGLLAGLEGVCGDGTVDPGEQCDDGNTTPGDGCDALCQNEGGAGVCGDGTVDPGEQCDDGNTTPGDGCDALCQNEGGAGVCGDGTVDPGEQCDDGNTTPGDGCNALCENEGDGFVCAPDPLEGCIPAAKASLSISEKKAGNEKLKAKLKSFEGATGQSDLGDPLTGSTRYDLCLYGPEGQLVGELSVDRAAENCGPKQKPCFKDKGGKGWLYKDPAAEASGTKKLTLTSGPEGKGKALWQAGNKAKKGQTTLPTGTATVLDGATSATLQLTTSDAACFEAELGTVKKADGELFKAKAP